HAALAVTDAQTGTPAISRIAFGLDDADVPLALVSALAPHRAALEVRPDCAFMVGEPGDKGDPLTHPRLMVQARASFADPAERPVLRVRWLALHPKAAVYADLPDFAFVRLVPVAATLNGGFARAYRLTPADLRP
ncbi:MAG TPA: pyridoxamine 5-phosphate oxidase, partial [Paracoccaceae bacterium]|nr:pyridoxamine 5-phosphate oxidase [Paracoccaceae bacterium]